MELEFIEVADGLLVSASAITSIDGVDDETLTVYMNNGQVFNLTAEYSKMVKDRLETVVEILVEFVDDEEGEEGDTDDTDLPTDNEISRFLRSIGEDLKDNLS